MDKSIIIQTQVLFDKLKSLFVDPGSFAKSNIWCNMQNVNDFVCASLRDYIPISISDRERILCGWRDSGLVVGYE